MTDPNQILAWVVGKMGKPEAESEVMESMAGAQPLIFKIGGSSALYFSLAGGNTCIASGTQSFAGLGDQYLETFSSSQKNSIFI
jgi:hypothetical protein